MHRLYICRYDALGQFMLHRHEWNGGGAYPRNSTEVTITRIAGNGVGSDRVQEAQWHGGDDAAALERAADLAMVYSTVDG